MSIATRRVFEVRGWHVLAAMLLFFGAVIAVNVAFAVIAVRSFPGEDVRRSYLQGLRYNDAIEARRTQAALGWRAEAQLVPSDAGAMLQVRVLDRGGVPLSNVSVTGVLQRSTDARFDRALAFTPTGDGRFVATLGDIAPGRWRLRARADGENGRARDFEAELTWSPSR